MNYLEFLQNLIAIGSVKLPLALQFIQAEQALVTEYADKGLFTFAISHNAIEPTAELLDAEGKVIALLNEGHAAAGTTIAHGAIGDGQLLRNLFAFVTAHPELLQLLLTLLKK